MQCFLPYKYGEIAHISSQSLSVRWRILTQEYCVCFSTVNVCGTYAVSTWPTQQSLKTSQWQTHVVLATTCSMRKMTAVLKIQIQLESPSKENTPEEAAGALTGQHLWSLNINRMKLSIVEHSVLWNGQLGHWISTTLYHGVCNTRTYVCTTTHTHTHTQSSSLGGKESTDIEVTKLHTMQTRMRKFRYRIRNITQVKISTGMKVRSEVRPFLKTKD